ncbi:hypothetical protein PHYSODRAFT_327063 [Phytophthora sojae]|uniref:PLD phosphodiesterase domain-containing protein n=1 Tax=Phytophthora sojae (strain P6497) TaxID=1094619 RepID=G4YXA5_PHYSP|nr:hypothetical protein PHYSODRAFT_327063 [Phytophthora sojae]EGZ26139.1 hypothetical protein PHYSODRAFT_327063 [Phytophthora sojae]|eukprot:XP_009521427.1 hypothetical protein PHYSODRAFT_327063 [Phytophthora sojae]
MSAMLEQRYFLKKWLHTYASVLQTGTLSKDDCYAVTVKFECSPRVVKDRFDKRGSPRKKRGRPRPNIGELADKLTEATAGNPVILRINQSVAVRPGGARLVECNFADIAHTVKMKPRTYRRYHDEVMLELMLRNAPAKGTWGRTIARRIVAAKDKRSLRIVIYADKKTMWNEDCHDVYAYLLENNVEVYVSLDSAMEHSKMWILDGRIIIEGSFNISVAALGVKEDRKPKMLRSSYSANHSNYFNTCLLLSSSHVLVAPSFAFFQGGVRTFAPATPPPMHQRTTARANGCNRRRFITQEQRELHGNHR